MTGASRARPGDRPCIPDVGRTNPKDSKDQINRTGTQSIDLALQLGTLDPKATPFGSRATQSIDLALQLGTLQLGEGASDSKRGCRAAAVLSSRSWLRPVATKTTCKMCE